MNNQSKKYDRTYHYPFSPGTTSDDRINANWWQDICKIKHLIHTEKLDGENNCLNRIGVFARSHATPTQSAWTVQLRQRWQSIRNDLGNLDIFVKIFMPFILLNTNTWKSISMFLPYVVRING